MPIPSRIQSVPDEAGVWSATGCFAASARVEVPGGTRAIGDLVPGALVQTLDHGAQPVRMVRQRRVGATVHVAAQALGNANDLIVSQQHRVLINDWRAAFWTGCDEVLVAAGDLINGTTIRPGNCIGVLLIQLRFDDLEIIVTDGCASESGPPLNLRVRRRQDQSAPRTVARPVEAACLLAA